MARLVGLRICSTSCPSKTQPVYGLCLHPLRLVRLTLYRHPGPGQHRVPCDRAPHAAAWKYARERTDDVTRLGLR
jgi:hypothetical protein